MVQRHETRGTIAAKGLVPLLDTLFQLLFALLVVSGPRTNSTPTSMLLRLPRVEPAESALSSSGRELVIEVDSGARVTLLGDPTPIESRAELDLLLAAALRSAVPEEASVEIRSDASAPHGAVVELLQHLRVLGFADVRLAAVADPNGTDLFGGKR